MRVATFNVCGWKSAVRKGLLEWIRESRIDILAIQELRTTKIMKPLFDYGYHFYFNPSKFHGTALLTKEKPLKLSRKLGFDKFDKEGRFIHADFGDFIFINAYMPHGGRKKQNLPYKLKTYAALIELLRKIKKPTILAGDFNVAHTEVDLARPKENENNIMFTREERKQIDRIVQLGFVDALRKFHPKKSYTWWLRAFNSKERDIGWRIDYIFISKQFEPFLKDAFVPKAIEISDHCPVIVELELK